MTSDNMGFKSALSHLAQDMRYHTRPVYRAQDRNGPREKSPEPLASVHLRSQNSTKRGTDQLGARQSLPTANYSHKGHDNSHKAPETSRYKEATQDKGSSSNDSDKEPLPQDHPYSGPDSYHTTTPAPPKSLLPPHTDVYQMQPPKESYTSNIFKYQPQKPKEPIVQPMDAYRIPPSTDFYKSIISPDPKELYKPPVDNYQLKPPKEIYEPQIDVYQHARPKESMKSPEQIYQPPKPKDSLTLPMGMYQPPKQKYYYKPPIDSYEPPLTKETHKPPLVLSPEFYKSMEAPKPHDMPPSVDSLMNIHHSSPSEDANNHYPQMPSYNVHVQDDMYVDYDPSSHSHKEKLNEHEYPPDHGHGSHEYVYSHHEPPTPPKKSYGPPPSPSKQPYGTPPPPSKDIYGAPPPPPKDIYRARPPPPRIQYGSAPPLPKGPYGAPPPPPKETYDSPPPPPKETYGAPPPPPKDSYGPQPNDSYGVPLPSPPPPKDSYGPQPNDSYGVPLPSPPPPKDSYGPQPNDSYGVPLPSPPLPKDSYGAPLPFPKEPYIYDASLYHHAYGDPPSPPMTPPPPPPPKRKRYGYYQIGRKLYLIPAYFTALFIPYVLALIIKSVLKRKVRAPFNYWAATQNRELGPDDTAKCVARALEAAERRYK